MGKDTVRGTSKVARYGWKVSDQPGEFRFIHKRDLRVDHTYQRNPKERDPKIIRIASDWPWIAFGALSVADRGGTFYVMDGQHRKLAADHRSDIQMLPCMVFATPDLQQEAIGFLAANINRKPMTAVQKFNGLVTACDPSALKAKRLIDQTGRTVGAGGAPTIFSCVAALMTAIKSDEVALNKIWPLVTGLCKGRPFHNDLISGLLYLEHHADLGVSLSVNPWRDRVVKCGYEGLTASIHSARIYHNAGGDRIVADGILKAINSRIRSTPFTITLASPPPAAEVPHA